MPKNSIIGGNLHYMFLTPYSTNAMSASQDSSFFLHDNENTHLLLQCHAHTTVRMSAVRTMNNTGTRTAASATSEGDKGRNKRHAANLG